jgi:hypothetical protein
VRYGIPLDDSALEPLDIATASARQAPRALVRVFAAAPAPFREDALAQHETLAAVAGPESTAGKTRRY